MLVLFFGGSGADLFYVGKTGFGVVRLALFGIALFIGVLLSPIFIGLFLVINIAVVLLLWQVVDLIKYLTMSEERFQQMVAG